MRLSRPRRAALLLLAFLAFLAPSWPYKLNVPKVLLPVSRELRVPFVLEAEGGCYSWYATRQDTVTVEPIYKNGTTCSQRALLFAQSTQATKLSSVVIAEDRVTGHLLRCDVIVDVIDSIEIISRTREIYVEDAPLELTVRALDIEGNTFSSLSGMTFEWNIAKDDDMDSLELSSKIRILKYSEAEYSPPDYIVELERAEKQGDRILVSGIKTGAAVVKVRIQEPVYKKISAALVRLLVLENVFLVPSHDIYLLVGTYIKYKVGKIVQGKITEVDLPLEHYELELRDQISAAGGSDHLPVAQLDVNTATVTAVQLGQVNLVFVHKNIHMRAASGLPNCTIYVVEAAFLGFTIQPGDRWVLEVRGVYTITVEVYDKASTKVYLSDNIRITYHFPMEYLEEIMSSANGSYHTVQVLKGGITIIKAALTSVLLQDGSEAYLPVPISHEQEARVYLRIKLTPSFLAFPHHHMEVLYRHRVQVEGGSGNFTWTSSNQSVVTVTIKGVVTAGLVGGQSTVQARDVQNPFHYGEIQVYVLRPTKMEFLPFHADIEIGQVLEAPLMMYYIDRETRETVAFTDCSLLELDVSTDKQGIFTPAEEGVQKPGQRFCSSIQLAAKALGHTLVTVSATIYQEYFEASATFATYEPLKAVNPVEVALVTWQSLKEVVFEGGPGPWILEPSRFFLELTMEHEEKIKVTQVRLPTKRKQNQYIYRIVCLELGEQVLTFRVGNQPGVLNPNPAVEMVQVIFICAHPASMSVTPVYNVSAGAQPCPLLQHNKQLIPVSSLRNTVLELAVFDQHRRKFDNFSSLVLEWKSSNETLAHFTDAKSMQMVAKNDGSGQIRMHGHQLLEVHQMKGTVLIRVSFVKFSERGSPKEVSNLLNSAAVELILVEDVTIVPENITMYNHPAIKEIFDLVEGSGYFLVNSSEDDIVNITYLEAESAIEVIPLQPGSLTMAVYDLCLAFLGPAATYLHVSDIYELEVDLVDKIEIGKSVFITVRVLSFHHYPFRSKYFKHMKLKLQAASAVFTLAKMEEVGEYSEIHVLQAVAVGQTTLVAIAWDKMGRKFTSPPRKVEVFPPFKLIPKKMTLIPHNMMQVMSEGGPQPQSIIHFSINNETVAVVNRLGQVTAKTVGTAIIQGTIQAVSEDTGRVIVFSQDQIELEVVQLRAVRIHVPATRLITATEMPVYVKGMTSMQTPFSFGSAKAGLIFQWSVSKRDVLDLLPQHSEVSLQLLPENNFAMVIYTKVAGRTSIKVTVQCLNVSAGQFEGNLAELSDEIQILVFDKLLLFSPECPTEQILMSTNSQLKLFTNREGAAFVSSRILKCNPNSSVIEDHGQGLLRAGAITGTAVLEVTSVELFGVNQTVITGVRVAPVSYMTISTSPKLYTTGSTPLVAFPLGMALTLTVEFYNNIGEKFHAQNTQIYLALNRDDLLLIRPGSKNYTYIAQAVNRGVTLLGIWDAKHPGMADYIPVPVEYAIEPDISKPSAVGDVICFSTPLVNQEGEPGMWHISPSGILEMDSVSGAAFVKSPGTATVFHDIPGIGKTYREVVVNSSSRLSPQLSPKGYLTNTPDSSKLQVFVATSSAESTLKGPCSPVQMYAISNLLLPESHLMCQVEFSNPMFDIPASKVFSIQSKFSIERGLYACLITAKPQSDEVRLALSFAEASVYVMVSLSSQQSKDGTQRILVPFLPAFYINHSELVFSSKQLSGEIKVLGTEKVLEKLEVHPSIPAIIVRHPEYTPDMPGLVSYPINVANLTSLRQRAAPIFINISCVLTGQRDAVEVKVLAEQHMFGQCSEAGIVQQLMSSYQILLFTLFAVLASTAVIFLTYNTFLTRVQTVPIVYIPTSAASQTGYYSPTNPQHHNGRNRMQHWLWSMRR
ncbi:nuclear pore membrane glycoprotein 210-like [Alligator mississippiensis]|uniref:nuclear pore membrane glycoprotein 210-like n=1 Tax=Alligator mississippiensis TaxID=8496 RepID=UPI0003D100E5|nr:nuclear pore membrane glycoprotein 210-like [Alligator mississippiensis]